MLITGQTYSRQFQLDDFAHNVQKLGSALELSIASRNVRSELRKVRQYFESTSEKLQDILAHDIKKKKRLSGRGTPRRSFSYDSAMPLVGSVEVIGNDHKGAISSSLGGLLRTLRLFAVSLQDFEDYVDRDGEKSMKKFIQQIAVRSRSLFVSAVVR